MNTIFEIKENGVAIITLARPKVFNSFNSELAQEVQSLLEKCHEERQIRAVVLTGEGKAFCAGQDLQEIIAPDGPPLSKILQENYNPIIRQIRQLQKPVIAAVNGVAAGAGANIALACDVVIASKSASFIQAFSKIGLIPDSGGTYFLPRLIGFQKASALMMLADKISAEEAERLGMIYKFFDDEVFMEESMKIADRLAAMPTQALWFTKKALNESMTNSLSAQLVLEDKLQSIASETSDYKEGVNAFLEKRPAVFEGK
jgi:2-(1,2-epoxy-1,2-dihydrophenyl)acetyl-CoA isomerase